jgi:linoleoyl-CoA desaturase
MIKRKVHMEKQQYISFTEDARSREFWATLKQRVDNYFNPTDPTKKKISKKGNWKLYLKTVIGFSVNISSYLKLIFFTPESWWAIILLSIVFALSLPFLGFNVGHDAAHNSYSKNMKVNRVLSHAFNYMGATVYEWITKHNVGHHGNTNIEGHDDDHNAAPWFRMSPVQERKPWHAYQAYYAPILYSPLYLDWVIVKDYQKYKSKRVASTDIPPRNLTEGIIFWATKAWWLFMFIALPIYAFGILMGLLWALCVGLLCGEILALVFQPAHITDKTIFPIPDENGKINMGRKEHQIATTCDFATEDPITTWFCGGLNFQVEHHLFPGICHIHYPAIHPIVEDTCEEFGVKFNSYKTFFGGERAHFKFLNKLGNKD